MQCHEEQREVPPRFILTDCTQTLPVPVLPRGQVCSDPPLRTNSVLGFYIGENSFILEKMAYTEENGFVLIQWLYTGESGIPIHGRRVGNKWSLWSLWTQTSQQFCDSMNGFIVGKITSNFSPLLYWGEWLYAVAVLCRWGFVSSPR